MDPAGQRRSGWGPGGYRRGHAGLTGPGGPAQPAPAQRARLLLAQGDLAAAARWTQENGLSQDDEPDYPSEQAHLALARVLLAQARPGPALALLDRMHAAAAAQDRVGSAIEIGALRALALAARCRPRGGRAGCGAHAGLPAGLCPGLRRRGTADGRAARWLITAQRSGGAAAEVPLGCLARLQRALAAQNVALDAGRRSVTAVPGLVEQLTSRELEVLEMLAAGRSNQAIASQLVVTLNTVKKHVSHVLGKLGAANRTEAVTRARELSLIP